MAKGRRKGSQLERGAAGLSNLERSEHHTYNRPRPTPSLHFQKAAERTLALQDHSRCIGLEPTILQAISIGSLLFHYFLLLPPALLNLLLCRHLGLELSPTS